MAHEPDAAARGADRGFHERRKADRLAQRLRGFDDLCPRLRQSELIEQPRKSGFAVRRAVAVEARQRQSYAAFQALPYPREQKALLMRRQQHIETAGLEQTF